MNRRRMKRTSRRTSSMFKLLFPWTIVGRMDREEKFKLNSICCNLEYNNSSVASSPAVAATCNDNRDSVRFLQLLFHEDQKRTVQEPRYQYYWPRNHVPVYHSTNVDKSITAQLYPTGSDTSNDLMMMCAL